MPAATSHALTAGFRPTVPPRSVPVSPSPARSVGHTGHPGHLLRPHTDPAPCSPRAGGAVAAQESRLHVRTHAAAARWSATRSLTLRSPNPTPKATGTRQSDSHTYLKAQSGRASLEGGGTRGATESEGQPPRIKTLRAGGAPSHSSTPRARTRVHTHARPPHPRAAKRKLGKIRAADRALRGRAALCCAGQTRAATSQLRSGTGRGGGGGKRFLLVQGLARARDPEKAKPGFNF